MVLRAPLVDLPKMVAVPAGLALVVSFLEVPPGDNVPTSKALYAQASPQTHVSATTPPTLLMHGDADDLVPLRSRPATRRRCARPACRPG